MTRSPPFLFALVLVFWSWQTGAWPAGLVLAGWLEWSLRAPQRWQIGAKSIERLVDLTSLLVVALVLYEYSQGPLASGIFAALRWSPLLLAPLISAQILSARPGLSYRALFLSQRRSRSPEAERTLDLRPVYLAATLLAAGTGAQQTPGLGYFFGVLGLAAWVSAWQLKGRRVWPWWLASFAAAALLAYLGQAGLSDAQRRLEETAVAWLSSVLYGDDDPYRARTALGEIGELKLSDRVLYRVTTPTPLSAPLLLRTASYDRYADTTWFTWTREFQPVGRVADGWQWGTPAAGEPTRRIRIGGYLPGGGGLLPVPSGTWRLDALPVGDLSRHPLGAVKAADGPPLLHYQAVHAQAASADQPPGAADLRVPREEQAALQALVDELELASAELETGIRRLRGFFDEQFSYTLELPGAAPGQTAVTHFLTERRQGHCEFFASATVLLLRQAGIPARYAVGYSVQEADRQPAQYLVRQSHAHAWALFWHQNRWWDLDTTPARWAELEAQARPFWQPLADLIATLWYRFNLNRLAPERDQNPWLWVVLAGLFAVLAYRMRLGKRFRQHRARRQRARAAPADSPLAPLAQALTRNARPRQPGETDRHWLQRLQTETPPGSAAAALDQLLRLNERARYRPGGLSAPEQQALRRALDQVLREWHALGKR